LGQPLPVEDEVEVVEIASSQDTVAYWCSQSMASEPEPEVIVISSDDDEEVASSIPRSGPSRGRSKTPVEDAVGSGDEDKEEEKEEPPVVMSQPKKLCVPSTKRRSKPFVCSHDGCGVRFTAERAKFHAENEEICWQ
jgi:hypothetical protein